MIDPDLHDRVRDCLARNYGLEGSLRRLPGENLNILITTGSKRRYVFKIVDQDMPRDVVELECAAVEHAKSKQVPIEFPQTMENRFGNLETRIELHKNGLYSSRLMSFVKGKVLSSMPDISRNLFQNVGETVALFDQAMRDFEHPAARRDHRWNLATASRHEATVARFGEPDRRSLLDWAFRGWRAAHSQLAHLPWQFIHGDAHDENMLVEGERVTGLIDFGDCGHNPAICDLAICLTYLMMRGPDPLLIAASVTEGYRSVREVSGAELTALYPLICARLAVSLCVARERAAIDPANPNWFGGVRSTWRLLEWLHGLGRESFTRNL